MTILIILAAIVFTWWLIPKLFGVASREDDEFGMDSLHGDYPRLPPALRNDHNEEI